MSNVSKDYSGLGILVIDMQNFFRKNIDNKQIIHANQKILNFGVNNTLPIYFLKYSNPTIINPNFIKEVSGFTNLYEYARIIPKYSDNGFVSKIKYGRGFIYSGDWDVRGDTELDLSLKEDGIEKLIISGINKTGCVKKTVKQAIKRGYELFSSRDLMNESEEKNGWFSKKLSEYFLSHEELIKFFEDQNTFSKAYRNSMSKNLVTSIQ